ncbi:Bug family tripartite tricarboxylate transporter substrate binding protein [Cupriavidus oxalaticus]|uniref:Bug family tripartite tricarboxylate transporter substrate binding protein n=1 Tax=Cupriavidus oxalaticus TaxID=96344 RepID=UPI004034C799
MKTRLNPPIVAKLLRAGAWVTLGAAAIAANAETFPAKPISMVVPFSAGGSSDVVARLIAQPLGQQLKQSVVVENRPGAGATIGTGFAAQKGQNGHVVLLAENSHTIAPAIYERLPYDPINDFAVVGSIGEAPPILAASKASGLKSVKDLLERSKAKPGSVAIGTGNGTMSHLMSELYQLRSNTKLQSVPYKGAAPALNDLLAGHIDLVFTSTVSAANYLSSGRIVPLAVAAKQRDKRLPNVPTFQEVGIDLKNSYWFTLLMPADTPEDVKARWRKELDIALARPEVVKKLDELGIDRVSITPKQAQTNLKEEAALWKQVAKKANIQAN